MSTAMTRTLLTVLSLSTGISGLAGCGLAPDAAAQRPGTLAESLPVVAESTPAPKTSPDASLSTFGIDVGAGVILDEDTYAITTNGRDWTLAWRGDAYARHFRGEIINGTRFSGMVVGGLYAGDTVQQTAANRIFLDTQTDALHTQSVTVRSSSEPVRFNLWIDGAPATYAVIFSSGGIESTSDDMPFDLVTGPFAAARIAPRIAPERAQLDHATASRPSTVAAPTTQPVFISAPAMRAEPESK